MQKIHFTNNLTPKNPFSPDGEYADDWVELRITNSTEYKLMTGKDAIFYFAISKSNEENWAFRAMDYVEYNLSLNRNIICSGKEEDFERAKYIYSGHSIKDPFLRSYEPPILVHSTTPHGYEQIMKDGTLKSWNKVNGNGAIGENQPIGALLGDPAEFSDYVMLGELGFWNEIVVSSKEKEYICMDADCEYLPGARFYFSTIELIKSGLLVRDGAHYKVKDGLPLSYLLFCATKDNITLDGKVTPRTFAAAADKAFGEHNYN